MNAELAMLVAVDGLAVGALAGRVLRVLTRRRAAGAVTPAVTPTALAIAAQPDGIVITRVAVMSTPAWGAIFDQDPRSSAAQGMR